MVVVLWWVVGVGGLRICWFERFVGGWKGEWLSSVVRQLGHVRLRYGDSTRRRLMVVSLLNSNHLDCHMLLIVRLISAEAILACFRIRHYSA